MSLHTIVLFFLLVSLGHCASGCNCSESSSKTPSKPPPSDGTGSLTATYRFNNSVGVEPTEIKVVFTGKTTAMGPGKDSFSQVEMKPIRPPTPTEFVSTTATGLRKGTWTVTATPDGIGAPWTCTGVNIPGSVTLDVSGPQPICSTP
jgi:hypothetical protein